MKITEYPSVHSGRQRAAVAQYSCNDAAVQRFERTLRYNAICSVTLKGIGVAVEVAATTRRLRSVSYITADIMGRKNREVIFTDRMR